MCIACTGVALAVAWSRIYLAYHTTRQVIAGSIAGSLFAVMWFVVVGILRQIGLLSWALDLPLARALRIRDLAVQEDICQAGWEKWEEKRIADKKNKSQ